MKRTMARAADAIRDYQKRRDASIIDPELTDLMKKLNPLNYQKGAWTLHMLRKILGDEVFFKGIRRYYNLYAGKNAATEDFQKVMESVSGSSLSAFFRQWFYQPGWPEYNVTWKWDEREKAVQMVFHQAQSSGLYDMPLDIAFQAGDHRGIRTVRVFQQDQSIHLNMEKRPASLEVDPDGWVLKSVSIIPVN
jgi:aminopeptidase N